MKTLLTPEESSKLIELGVDAKLSSIYIRYGATVFDKEPKNNPIFTLTDILAIFQKNIGYGQLLMNLKADEWVCTFKVYTPIGGSPIRKTKIYPELIDSLYQLLCWVITN